MVAKRVLCYLIFLLLHLVMRENHDGEQQAQTCQRQLNGNQSFSYTLDIIALAIKVVVFKQLGKMGGGGKGTNWKKDKRERQQKNNLR